MEIVNDLKSKAGDKEAILLALNELQLKRTNWVKRISNNQIKLLSSIDEKPISIKILWAITKNLIPECGYKEFRFRLHELEWLSLVSRYWSQKSNCWIYQLTQYGKETLAST
jgi:hypothetical protein